MNYTWATNLLKTADMAVGQVSYKNNKLVVKLNIEKDKDIVRKLLKSKKEEFPNFEADHRDYLKEQERAKNEEAKMEKIAKEEEEKAAKAIIKAKEDELKEFMELGGADEDDGKVYAGGDNQHLEDDFM